LDGNPVFYTTFIIYVYYVTMSHVGPFFLRE
jgi:hypothetical protein